MRRVRDQRPRSGLRRAPGAAVLRRESSARATGEEGARAPARARRPAARAACSAACRSASPAASSAAPVFTDAVLSLRARRGSVTEADFPPLSDAAEPAPLGGEGVSDEDYALRLQLEEQRAFQQRLYALSGAGLQEQQRGEEGRDEEGAGGLADVDAEASEEGRDSRSPEEQDAPYEPVSELTGMGYEELTALGEFAGVVSRGADETTLGRLCSRAYRAPSDGSEEQCAICRVELEEGDKVADLECGHAMHVDCAKAWFAHKAACPVCGFELKKAGKGAGTPAETRVGTPAGTPVPSSA